MSLSLLSVGEIRVLIVEDEVVVARDFDQQLRAGGYVPVGAIAIATATAIAIAIATAVAGHAAPSP